MRLIWLGLVLFSLTILTIGARAAEYDVYVDQSNKTGAENGTKGNPFNTISEAIEKAMENNEDSRKIWVAAGEYQEQVDLKEGIKLYGAGEKETVIIGKDSSGGHLAWTVKMENNSKIKDVGVKYGKQGVLVVSGADAEIDSCRIYEARLNGIYVEKAKSFKEKFVLKDSKIYDSGKRGIYVYKKKVEITDSEIYDNNEEGLDLHSGARGTISGNKFFNNGESGLELELRSLKLNLKKNTFSSNEASGINFQYRGKNKSGEIKMSENKIKKNDHYGIKCGKPVGGKPSVTFFSSAITFSQDVFQENKMGKFGEFCKF